MDDRCVEVNGSSEALNLLRGGSAGSSSLCLLSMASSAATLDDAFKPMGPEPACSSMNVGGCRNLCSSLTLQCQDALRRTTDLRLADLQSQPRAAHQHNIGLKHVSRRFTLSLRASLTIPSTEKLAVSSLSHLELTLIPTMSKILFWSGFGTSPPSPLLFPRAV